MQINLDAAIQWLLQKIIWDQGQSGEAQNLKVVYFFCKHLKTTSYGIISKQKKGVLLHFKR